MTTTTLYAIEDGYMQLESPTTAGSTTYVPTGFFSTPQTNRGLLMLDVTSLKSDTTITAGTLKLTVQANFLGTSHTISVYALKRRMCKGGDNTTHRAVNGSSWNSSKDAAWTTAGASDTTDDRDATAMGTVNVTSATSGTVSITLTANGIQVVQDWVSGERRNNGMILVASVESGSNTLIRWEPHTHATAGSRPQMDLTYTPGAAKTLLDDLIAYWPMDLNTWLDSTGHGHTLSPTNTPTIVAGGIFGDTTHFVAASSQKLTNDDAALKLANQDWTWAGWVKLTDNTEFYAVVSCWKPAPANVGGGGFLLFYHKVSVLDYFVAQLYDDFSEHTTPSPDNVIADVIGFTGGNPATGAWHFIAVRHDSVRHFFQLFIDGNVPDSSDSHWASPGNHYYSDYPGTPVAGDQPFTFGVNESGQYMNGDIGPAALWGRWLDNDEINTTLYNGGAGTDYPFGLTPPAVITPSTGGGRGHVMVHI